ncbi:MAG: DUF2834 domain-containing protein [Rubrivivax sp.]|nr:MAG: DUF2834 domain-containing protein [Rubrivivax sp.]
MTRNDKLLCALYAAISLVALYATWSNNLAFFAMPDNGGLMGFLRLAYANPAAASLANDLFLFGFAATLFMLLEAKRLRIRFVWVYVVLSVTVAISVFFPLFLIARQKRLAELSATAA